MNVEHAATFMNQRKGTVERFRPTLLFPTCRRDGLAQSAVHNLRNLAILDLQVRPQALKKTWGTDWG